MRNRGSEGENHVRGSPFYKMNGYSGAPVMAAVIPNLGFENQLDFLGRPHEHNNPHGLRELGGYFFERVLRAHHGGIIQTRQQLCAGKDKGLVLSMIDLVDLEGNLREAKSVKSGKEVKLVDRQVSRHAYSLARGSSIIPVSNRGRCPRLYYHFFRHGLEGIEKNKKYREELHNLYVDFGVNMRAIVVLPFSVVFRAWDPREGKLLSTRFEGDEEHEAYTRFNSSNITKLLKTPGEGLEALDVNPDLYYFKKMRSPAGVTYRQRELNQCPMLIVEEKAPRQMLAQFREQDFGWLGQYMNLKEKSKISEYLGPLFDQNDADTSFDPEEFSQEKLSEGEGSGDVDLPF